MYKKYLPIGSIVKLKDLSKKIMIIGYYSLEYQNSITIYDYVGCTYPEGLLLKNNMYSFNHEEIINVDFIGYEDDNYKSLNNNLNGQIAEFELSDGKDSTPENQISNTISETNINDLLMHEDDAIKNESLFDINEIDMKKTSNIEPDNSFVFDEKQIDIKLSESINNNDSTLFLENFENFNKFDENGFVISDEEETPNNNVVQENIEEFPMPHYEFDENGIIINN